MIPNARRAVTALCSVALLACAFARVAAHATQAAAEKPPVNRLHPLFTDHMVLQRGVRFPVWGWTTPGARVRVRMRGVEATAVADSGGKWTARLGPFDAGGPYTLTVRGALDVTLTEV